MVALLSIIRKRPPWDEGGREHAGKSYGVRRFSTSGPSKSVAVRWTRAARFSRAGRTSATETTGAKLVGPDGAQEVQLAEGRPVGVAEVELAVGALPGQEPGEPDLARGADDELRVADAESVQMRFELLGGERIGESFRRHAFRHERSDRGPSSLHDLVAARIAKRQRDAEPRPTPRHAGAW